MSFFKKKIGVAVIAVLIIAAVSSVITHFSGTNPITAVVRTVMSPFTNGAAHISRWIDEQVNFIWEASAYKEQNEQLEAQITELKKKNKEVAVYQEEVERLNTLLELKNSITNYSTVAAVVIGYSSSNQYDRIEINKGVFSGINPGNTVITADGVVGTVTEAGPNWAMVDTVIAPKSSTGIRVSRTDDVGVIEGDSELCREMMCKLTFVDKEANIIVGDILETSGTGGIYPPSLNVGTIREISADSMGMLNYAVVEPTVDFSELHEVLVINGVVQ